MYGIYQYRMGLRFTGKIVDTKVQGLYWIYKGAKKRYKYINVNDWYLNLKAGFYRSCYTLKELEKIK